MEKKKKKKKSGLGEGAVNLDLKKSMRSRISDTLTPPPTPPVEKTTVEDLPPEFDPNIIADKLALSFPGDSEQSSFEACFHLKDRRQFSIRGDKNGFAGIQSLEPFTEVHEKLLLRYHNNIIKIEIFTDEKGLSFSSYNDFLEWLGF
jgi:hypothetical protein